MVSIRDLWNLVIEELKKEVPYIALQTWFDDIEVIALQERTLTLYSPVVFKRETIEKYYLSRLQKVLCNIFSETIEVELLSEQAYRDYLNRKEDQLRSLRDCGEYTFENFVVGPSNRLAFGAAKAVATEHSRYNNPLVIYGASGLGKTHLLNAIAAAVAEGKPDASVVYMKGEDFTNELIDAIAQERRTEFRNKYRNAEYFLMDDIQFIAGKKQTQEEFFNTFDKLYEANCQIVLALDRPLSELPALQDRIRNRFEGGLIVEIEAPDFETRRSIIRSKAAQRKIVLTEDEIATIAHRITCDVRKLEGVLNRVKAIRLVPDCGSNSDDIALALQTYQLKNEKNVTPQEVIDTVAANLHVDAQLMLGRSHTKNIAQARQIAMYLLCEICGQSTTAVGRIFNRDHSTVVYAIGKVKEKMASDTVVREVVSKLSEQFNCR